jgi:hypothetical protein
MAGKGSKPRPMGVDRETFNANYDRIFGNKNKAQNQREQALDELTRLSQEMGGYYDEQDPPLEN